MIYDVTVAWGYHNLIIMSADAVSACYYDEAANCAGWQQDMVDAGLRELGNWIYDSAVNLNGMATQLAQEGVDWSVYQAVYDEATVANLTASEVQQ